MKIRSGYVSNSSTSSFIIIGYENKTKREHTKTYCENIMKKYNYVYDKEFIWDNWWEFQEKMKEENEIVWYKHYFGKLISEGEYESFGDLPASIDKDTLKKTDKELKSKYDFIPKDSKIKVIVDTRSC